MTIPAIAPGESREDDEDEGDGVEVATAAVVDELVDSDDVSVTEPAVDPGGNPALLVDEESPMLCLLDL